MSDRQNRDGMRSTGLVNEAPATKHKHLILLKGENFRKRGTE